MSMLDLLLGADNLTERPEDELEVTRLSKKLGEKFVLKAHALTSPELEELPVGKDRAAHIILAGISDPDFHAEDLRKKYTPSGRSAILTPVELIKKLFLPGEIININNAIMDLSGFSDEAIAKLEKN